MATRRDGTEQLPPTGDPGAGERGSGEPGAARRRMRAPERRAQLLEVARRVFGTSGYHAVSMEEVAEQAGVTKPILYDHFSSKKDLYLALLDADLAVLLDMVKEALASARGNRERIRASFQAYFDFVDEQADGFRLLVQETVGAERDFRERVADVRDQILSEVAEPIKRKSGEMMDLVHAE